MAVNSITISNLPIESAKKSLDWIINFWVNYNFKRKQKYIQLYKHYIQTFKVPWIPILEDIWQLARMMIENLEHLKYHSIVDKWFLALVIAPCKGSGAGLEPGKVGSE